MKRNKDYYEKRHEFPCDNEYGFYRLRFHVPASPHQKYHKQEKDPTTLWRESQQKSRATICFWVGSVILYES